MIGAKGETLFDPSDLRSSATLSPCGTYRYDLVRRWAEAPIALWVMLNPSTADASVDDPTIRRCVNFSKREGMGGLVVVNLFALRSSSPSALLEHQDPVGPGNQATIDRWLASREVALVIGAWGSWVTGRVIDRPRFCLHAGEWRCLGGTSGNEPRHPLYVQGDQPLEPWPPVGAAVAGG